MKHDPERWLHDYHTNGYLVVEDLVDPATLQLLSDELDRITAAPRSLPEGLLRHITFENEYARKKPGVQDLSEQEVGDAIKLIMELPSFAPVFAELIPYPPLLDVLQTLFGSSEFHFHNYKCIVKAPRVSSTFIWHRDLPYLKHTTANLLTAMLCIDPMTEANGATVVYPGSHRLPDGYFRAEDTHLQEDELPRDIAPVTVCCPAGSAVIFHVNIIHGGGANRSPQPRRNVIGIWAGPDTYPVGRQRYVYQDVYPRSQDPARQEQMRQSFPTLALNTPGGGS